MDKTLARNLVVGEPHLLHKKSYKIINLYFINFFQAVGKNQSVVISWLKQLNDMGIELSCDVETAWNPWRYSVYLPLDSRDICIHTFGFHPWATWGHPDTV